MFTNWNLEIEEKNRKYAVEIISAANSVDLLYVVCVCEGVCKCTRVCEGVWGCATHSHTRTHTHPNIYSSIDAHCASMDEYILGCVWVRAWGCVYVYICACEGCVWVCDGVCV